MTKHQLCVAIGRGGMKAERRFVSEEETNKRV
jgi:hypothetical protein